MPLSCQLVVRLVVGVLNSSHLQGECWRCTSCGTVMDMLATGYIPRHRNNSVGIGGHDGLANVDAVTGLWVFLFFFVSVAKHLLLRTDFLVRVDYARCGWHIVEHPSGHHPSATSSPPAIARLSLAPLPVAYPMVNTPVLMAT
ncbi:hypothetical protein EV702DRAFT_173516 [Suillus placidus]|uniref:Uncharacterized protein n=1 Tax=Suillus placidus TaxID=48579 RepID=A0A9P6ZWV8_9AGAM|nr:hypothetical protein EV702DRAFT_173516 [Suillus placidus]